MSKQSESKVVVNPSEYTDAQREKVAEIKKAGGKAEVVKCVHCGKILVRDISVEKEQGDYCDHLFNELGYTAASLAEHRKTLSLPEVPEGYVKVAQLHRICESNNIPVARMVNAMGGDRGLKPAARPEFKPVYVGNARWLSPWCASKEGLDFLRTFGQGAGKAPGASKAASKKTTEAGSIEDAMNALFTATDGQTA